MQNQIYKREVRDNIRVMNCDNFKQYTLRQLSKFDAKLSNNGIHPKDTFVLVNANGKISQMWYQKFFPKQEIFERLKYGALRLLPEKVYTEEILGPEMEFTSEARTRIVLLPLHNVSDTTQYTSQYTVLWSKSSFGNPNGLEFSNNKYSTNYLLSLINQGNWKITKQKNRDYKNSTLTVYPSWEVEQYISGLALEKFRYLDAGGLSFSVKKFENDNDYQIYLTDQILFPGDMNNVWSFTGTRREIENYILDEGLSPVKFDCHMCKYYASTTEII